MFNRYYWLQIGLIALSIVVGLACSAWVIKGSLLKTALEQEMEHYWLRIERNPNADLPDTKKFIWISVEYTGRASTFSGHAFREWRAPSIR